MKSFALVLAALLVPSVALAEVSSPAPPAESVSTPSVTPTKVTPPFSDSAFDRSHLALEAAVGIQAPLGMAGISAVYAPVPLVSLELGVGTGASGMQTSAMARLSLMGSLGVSLGAGVSRGAYTWSDSLWASHEKHWDAANWGNVELSLHGSTHDVLFRAFLGHSSQFLSSGCTGSSHTYGDTPDTSSEACTGDGGTQLVYAGIALRAAMPLGM